MANLTDNGIQQVWNKGTIVEGNDPNVFRKDRWGAWMQRNKYGNRDSSFGWEADHILAESRGGKTVIENLQPLQWQNNVGKSDKLMTEARRSVTSSGTKNILIE